jgi:chromate transporter
MTAAQLLDLFLHCTLLSLLAIGGAVATIPDLQRLVVVERHWITDADFTTAVALAQASPGPNLLFIPVVGYSAGGLAGAAVALVGMLVPSTVLTLAVSRWGRRRRDSLAVRTFVAGMAPITLGLLVATGGLLAAPVLQQPLAPVLLLVSVVLAWRTRLHPLWLVLAGAVAGGCGLV